MNKLKLAIGSDDDECLEALSNYFNVINKDNFSRVSVFSNFGNLKDYLLSSRVDVLLLSWDFYKNLNVNEHEGTMVLFKEDFNNEIRDGFKFVSKYTPGDKLNDILVGYYIADNNISKNRGVDSNKAYIISAYSAASAVGKTIFSSTVAKKIASRNQKVLYLNFEDIPSYNNLFTNGSDDYDFSDILSESLNKDGNVLSVVISSQNKDVSGAYYFNPPNSITDYDDFSSEQIIDIIKKLSESGYYEYIVIDMSSSFDKFNRGVLEISDKIFFLTNNSKTSVEKTKFLEKNIKLIDGRLIDSGVLNYKLEFILNKTIHKRENRYDSIKFNNKSIKNIIEFNPKIASGEKVDMYSSFAKKINDIIKNI